MSGIASLVFTVSAAIYTALLLPLLQQYLKARVSRVAKQQEEGEAHRRKISLTYLNPLRLWLEETYVRLSEISTRLDQSTPLKELASISPPESISQKDAQWFNGEGCYLASTCYITACLFFAIGQVRDNIPYLQLSKEEDTQLMTLMFYVSHGFLQDLGVFYVTQPSIGRDVYRADQNRLMTYREFCVMLQNAQERVWCDRLLFFYMETGQGEKRERLQKILGAIANLSQFLDQHIGQGVSIETRLKAEGMTTYPRQKS